MLKVANSGCCLLALFWSTFRITSQRTHRSTKAPHSNGTEIRCSRRKTPFSIGARTGTNAGDGSARPERRSRHSCPAPGIGPAHLRTVSGKSDARDIDSRQASRCYGDAAGRKPDSEARNGSTDRSTAWSGEAPASNIRRKANEIGKARKGIGASDPDGAGGAPEARDVRVTMHLRHWPRDQRAGAWLPDPIRA